MSYVASGSRDPITLVETAVPPELSPYGDWSLTPFALFSDELPPKEPVMFANLSEVALHPAASAAKDTMQEIFKTREIPVTDSSTLRMVTLHKLTEADNRLFWLKGGKADKKKFNGQIYAFTMHLLKRL